MNELVASMYCLLAFSSLGYVVSLVIKDASLADVLWGPYFIAVALLLLSRSDSPTQSQKVIVALTAIWGFRLFIHIARRKIGKPEDFRYQEWRKQWGEWFTVRSYLQNYVMQAFLAVLISLSAISAFNSTSTKFGYFQYLGVVIWVFGFIFESVADKQLANFIATNKIKGKILSTGLWKYSRHPNYFGEITQWWGLWVITLGLSASAWAIISPITITILIMFVSGIPLLERRYKDDQGYQEYAKVTSKLIPLPSRRK